MTDEQKQTVAEIRNSVKKWGSLSVGGAVEQIETLLEIIDDLQKEVEQLTKERDEARGIAKRFYNMYVLYS